MMFRVFCDFVHIIDVLLQNSILFATPLYKLRESKQWFQWSSDCEQAFRNFKNHIVSWVDISFSSFWRIIYCGYRNKRYRSSVVLSQIQDHRLFKQDPLQGRKQLLFSTRELLITAKALCCFFFINLYDRDFLLWTDHAVMAFLG